MALKNVTKLKSSASSTSSGYTVMTEEEFTKWLMNFDKNGDGLISKSELQNILRCSSRRRFSGWRSSHAIREADFDGDGCIDEDEIRNMVCFAKKNFGIKIVPY